MKMNVMLTPSVADLLAQGFDLAGTAGNDVIDGTSLSDRRIGETADNHRPRKSTVGERRWRRDGDSRRPAVNDDLWRVIA